MEGIGTRHALATPPLTSVGGVGISVSSIASHRGGLIRDPKMPRPMRQGLARAYRELSDGGPVNVRWQGSRAGGRTVAGDDAFIAAVVEVWAELWSEARCREQLEGDATVEPTTGVSVEPVPPTAEA